MKLITYFLAVCVFCFPLATYADSKEQEDFNDNDIPNYSELDPLEKFNRGIFRINKGLDLIILKPLSKTYKTAIPQFFRDRIHNFLYNLTEPINFINGVLQLDPKKITTALSRFMINSSFGLAGIHDIASEAGLYYIESGFSDTLRHYSVSKGAYIVLPVIGSSSVRDTIGFVTNIATDPFAYVFRPVILYSRTGISVIDKRASILKTTDLIEQSSVDEYATYRSLYFQKNPR